MYNNYGEPKGSFTHSLKDTDIHLAATLHPVKNASFQYRLHKYFLMRDSLHRLRKKLCQLQRQLNDVADELQVVTGSSPVWAQEYCRISPPHARESVGSFKTALKSHFHFVD